MNEEHREELVVRDYECDLQGIVNNAVYQHYLEHARHQFLKSLGLDFAKLSRDGIDLVVVRAELDYLFPLRPGDCFTVITRLQRESRIRFGFLQRILRSDGKLILKARILGTALNACGRPSMPAVLADRLPASA